MKRICMNNKKSLLIWLFGVFAVMCSAVSLLSSSLNCWYSISLYRKILLFKTAEKMCKREREIEECYGVLLFKLIVSEL